METEEANQKNTRIITSCSSCGLFGRVLRPNYPPELADPTTPTNPTPVDPAKAVTRGDIENVLSEVAWDYFIKDKWLQYDSAVLNSLCSP